MCVLLLRVTVVCVAVMCACVTVCVHETVHGIVRSVFKVCCVSVIL